MNPRAELIADRGDAAASEEFFRSPAFLAAEQVTHSLRIEAAESTVTLPLVVREVPGSELRDAISPYGYPGGSVRGKRPGPAPAIVDWSATGLLSVFVRERIGGEATLAGARERSRVQVHDPLRPRAVRARLAEQIRGNARRGWKVEVRAGPGASDAEVDAFARLYAETMIRARASARYFFEPGYFRSILGFERSWLLLARRPGEGSAAAGAGAIAAVSDGTLHYYLGGTADLALGDSPFKNVVAAMLDLADEIGLALNLGGGLSEGDGLETFKRGFANRELAFRTHEIVSARAEYRRLAAGREAGRFFPAYRAPS